jgi:hypothetical protein
MTTRKLTRGVPANSKQMYIEARCWTCQRPIMRQIRKEQLRYHYCSMVCWRAATALRQQEKLWAQVRQDGECWIWHGLRDKLGYGHITVHRRHMLVHRIVYILARGHIPDDCVLDHLCRRPPCVNPAHLEAVPQRVNVFRGLSHVAANRHKTHCAQGHPYTPDNTLVQRDGSRMCRQCNRNHARTRTEQRIHRLVRAVGASMHPSYLDSLISLATGYAIWMHHHRRRIDYGAYLRALGLEEGR